MGDGNGGAQLTRSLQPDRSRCPAVFLSPIAYRPSPIAPPYRTSIPAARITAFACAIENSP